ncbi:MAG: carboxypeptidase-like regulatory domain-containing protein, partial [Gemmatimonadaceae bacterium]
RMAAVACAVVAVAGAVACASDEAGGTTVARESAATPPPVIAVPTVPYRPATVPSDAAISGTVTIAGTPPAEVVVRPTMDQRVCGTQFTERTLSVRGDRLADVVVWLADVRTGRQLPLGRRFDVTNVGCRLEPRVQAVLAGGTLNVRSRDPIPQRTRVVRHDTKALLAIIEHTDFGQVVPDDGVLSRPGLLELSSDLHPWTRGWVAVFDHPYFDVTTADGAFSLEGVPPGSYTLAAWHERLGRIEQPVLVGTSQRVSVTLTFGAAPESELAAGDGAEPGAAEGGD